MTGSYPQRSVFTAERRPATRPGGETAQAGLAGVDAGRFADAMEALRAQIRSDIETIVQSRLGDFAAAAAVRRAEDEAAAPTPAPEPAGPPPRPALARPSGMTAEEELALLKREIHSMSETIERTKAEIKAIYSSSAEKKRMDVMRDELGSVVKDTEIATGSILESMESVDDLAQVIKASTKTPEIAAAADGVLDQVVKVFETCNFQDLTGQRINKVVNTMKHIEERIRVIVGIWGEDAFGDHQSDEVKGQDDLEKTLATTYEEADKVTQADIDKMFS